MKNTHTQDLLHTLYSMAFLVEARDPYTGGHLWRVSQYSTRLALACGLSKQDAVIAGLGGFLHFVLIVIDLIEIRGCGKIKIVIFNTLKNKYKIFGFGN